DSYAVAEGASISSYSWDVQDGTITSGTASDAAITVTFPAGFRWISLTVTDSNGVTNTTRRPILAVDPDDDPTLKSATNITLRLTQNGNTLTANIPENIPRSSYPDGTLVMLRSEEH